MALCRLLAGHPRPPVARPFSHSTIPPRSATPFRAPQSRRSRHHRTQRRFNSSQSAPPPPPPRPPKENGSTATSTTTSRLARVLDRLPRRLQPYASRLRSAPLSHAAAFLALHEITAVVPLLGLFGLFHYTDLHVAPVGWVAERYGPYVDEGLARFERYFRRKGWFGFSSSSAGAGEGAPAGSGSLARQSGGDDAAEQVGARVAGLQDAQGPYRVVVEVALAYAITKALMPLRIAASIWATPWFAGVLVRTRALLSGRKTK